MNQYFLKTNMSLLFISALLSMIALSCESTSDTDTKGYSFQGSRQSGKPSGSGPGGGQDSPEMQRPQIAESTEFLLKIESLVDNDNPMIALTSAQEESLLPVLMEWQKELDSGRKASSDEFMNTINGQLSVAQAEYEPELGPPGRETGMPQGPPPGANGSSDRPMSPPSDIELLNNILDKLS